MQNNRPKHLLSPCAQNITVAHPKRRLDIQGLRALAVLLVALFHLMPDTVPGGYVGVDIFFVISGFLITGHMLREVKSTGKIDVLEFWARRIRRLLPAAFLVLGFCVLVTLFLLNPTVHGQNIREITASALYVQNWLLAQNSVDYLAQDNTPSLVQHYWSLSVEEQFYLFSPLLILLALFLTRKIKKDSPRLAVGLVLSPIILASISYSIYLTPRNSTAYFVTTTRAWEFAIGGIVALLPEKTSSNKSFSKYLHICISWIMWAILISSGLEFNSATVFPGWIAAIPVFATAILLWMGDSSQKSSVQFLTHWYPVQIIGDISYSLYLWHWPLVVIFLARWHRYPNIFETTLLLCLMLALAVVSKYWVEDPFRKAPGILRLKSFTYGITATCMFVFFAIAWSHTLQTNEAVNKLHQLGNSTGSSITYDGTQSSLDSDPSSPAIKNSDKSIPSPECFGANAILNKCADPYLVTDNIDPTATTSLNLLMWPIPKECTKTNSSDNWPAYNCSWDNKIGTENTKPKQGSKQNRLVFLGDSHAWQYMPAFSKAVKEKFWTADAHIYMSCQPFMLDPAKAGNEHEKLCVKFNQKVKQIIIKDASAKFILLASRLDYAKGREEIIADYIREFTRAGKTVIWLRQAPGTPIEKPRQKAPTCVAEHMEEYDPCVYKPPVKEWERAVTAAQKAGAKILDTWNIVCAEGSCHMVLGGTLVYADDNHFSYSFSNSLKTWLAEQLERIIR